ncbi:MAG: YkgJ family cysteine cluster protein [Prolixibacteraceae bacterium]
MKVYPTKDNVRKMALDVRDENERFFKRLKKKIPGNLDEIVHDLHDEAFSNFDCLTCANCCSSISPMITDKDVERLAKPLKLKPSQVIEQYMHLDEDHDYVFNTAPCPFLMADNYCSVYEYRPKACREYPHTNRRRFSQLLNLTLKNCEVCPIVFAVVEGLKEKLP